MDLIDLRRAPTRLRQSQAHGLLKPEIRSLPHTGQQTRDPGASGTRPRFRLQDQHNSPLAQGFAAAAVRPARLHNFMKGIHPPGTGQTGPTQANPIVGGGNGAGR